MSYKGDSYIQFIENKDKLQYSSFIFDPLDVTEKTFEIEVLLLGHISDKPRYFGLKQVEYVEWVYIYDNFGVAVDSVRKNIKQAVEGEHFRMPSGQDMVLGANELTAKIPITLLRGEGLNRENHYLRLELTESSGDIMLGAVSKQTNVIVISDMFTPPSKWIDGSKDGIWLIESVLGEYSMEKHRLMYLVSGLEWDNDDISILSDTAALYFYMGKFQEALREYEGEHGEPMKDENGKIISFPFN